MAKPKSTSKAGNTAMQSSTIAPNTTSEKENTSQGSTSSNDPPPLENIPTHAGTPWPRVGSMSGNLFELRKDWSIPPHLLSTPQ